MHKTIYVLITLLFGVSTSNAQNDVTWNPGQNIAPSASGNEHPRMAVNGSGQPLIIWHHASRCMFSRWDGTAFTTPVLLNPSSMTIAGASWMGPDIAAKGDTVYVVFKETPESSVNAHVYCVSSYDGGATFSEPVQVDHIADSLSRFPTVSIDPAGNPLVGFMKFDASFGEARWAVARSADWGNSFATDVKASGWSDANATVCDCCPGAIANAGNNVAMLYRDNNANIRDTWAGISTDNAATFSGGIGIDQQNWQINACPSTGPDGVVIGDTLYATFANGASGKSLIYYNKTYIPGMTGSVSTAITGQFAGLSQQNYPRMATDGKALAITWMQIVSGSRQCILSFTNDITKGLPAVYDTVDLNDITNCDVAISNGKIFVVWQDDNSGTVKYRSGSFTPTSGAREIPAPNVLSVYPNPANASVTVSSESPMDNIMVVNAFGQIIYRAEPNAATLVLDIDQPGMYSIVVRTGNRVTTAKLIVMQAQ